MYKATDHRPMGCDMSKLKENGVYFSFSNILFSNWVYVLQKGGMCCRNGKVYYNAGSE